MINKLQMPKAYVEVLEILKYISLEDVNKVPDYLIENMKKEMDLQYKYHITNIDDFEHQAMLEETQAILAVLFRDYWATDEQREKIKLKEKYDLQQLENEKAKKYNPNDIFKNKQCSISNNNLDEYEKKDVLIEYKEPLFKRILNKIKSIFNNKNN